MHISRLHARHFKRFHDLTIELHGAPRLVVMCGPNGMGKSSVIDALRMWHGGHGAGEGWAFDESYHRRAGEEVALDIGQMIEVEFVEGAEMPDARKLVYARSAYRHEPSFSVGAIQRAGDIFSAPRVHKMIDAESKVSDNYQRLMSAVVDDLFSGSKDGVNVGALRDEHIGKVRDTVLKLFPNLELQGPGDPLSGGTFFFRKDGQAEFRYQNLSGGEKAAFDLVLDLVVKTEVYDNTVICLDEPELHLNTRLQRDLLDVLLELTPPQGQLWIATHAVGMMRGAQELWSADHAAVAFLDFEDQDFNVPVSLSPVVPSRDFWSRSLRVTLDDMADLIAPAMVVLCEGRPAGGVNVAKAEFDARCYRRIFGSTRPDVDFLSVGNASEVHQDRVELGRAIQAIVAGTKVIRVVDRDMRSPQEVIDLQNTGTRVLSRRHLEAFLLDDEVLFALAESVGRPEMGADLVAARDASIAGSVARGNDADDFKSAAGEFYVKARQLLALAGGGNTTEAFLADTLAPLLRPGMTTFAELAHDLFG